MKKTMNEKQSSKNQEASEFIEFIKNIDLKKIWLVQGDFKVYRISAFEGDNTYFHDHDYKLEPLGNDRYIVSSISSISAKNANDKELFEINFEFNLLYLSEIEFTDDFFKKFKDTVLPSHSYPYEREYVQNLIVRMDLPSLTLPIWRSPILPPNKPKQISEDSKKPKKEMEKVEA